MNILLNLNTKRQVKTYLHKPGQSLGIIAPNESGKLYLARYISNEITANKGFVHIIKPSNNKITIEQIRQLNYIFKQKNDASSTINQIIIVHRAELLSKPAQHALLKKLEEPPSNTIIILTFQKKNDMLPTIISRLKIIKINKVSFSELRNYYPNYDNKQLHKIWLIADGRMGLINGLIKDQNHELLKTIDLVKQIISSTRFERLNTIDKILKNDINIFLDGLEILSKSALINSAKNNNVSATLRWRNIISQNIKAKQKLAISANPKLTLINLMLEI